MTYVKHRPNMWPRQSEECPDLFGTCIHKNQDDGILRSAPEKPKEDEVIDVPIEEYRNC